MTRGSVLLRKCALTGLFLTSSSLTAAPVQNLNYQPHQSIIQNAEQFLRQNIDSQNYSRIEITMGKLDPRLKLSQCSQPLSTKLAPGSQFQGKSTVHVKCDSDAPWTVFINANIDLYTQALHTTMPMARNHILTKDDLAYTEINISKLRNGYFTRPEHLIGKQLKRRLEQNRLIKANHVKSPTLIKRGELVSIVAENSGYSVKMSGIAMSNGSKGDRVQVKNTSSKRIIEGVVTQAGTIRIN